MSTSMRHRTLLAVASVVSLVALATSTPSAAASSADSVRTGSTTTPSAQTAGATQSAADHARAQVRSHRLADRLTRQLGARHTGGAYISAAGKVVVTVTAVAAARTVRDNEAVARRVAFSSRQLNRVQSALDRYSRSASIGAVQGWYVDIPTNTVVVTTLKGASGPATKRFLTKTRAYGQRVELERTTTRNVDTALYGGQQVDMSNGYVCSLGFNAQKSSGGYAFVTAGHCTEGYPTFSRNGVTLGSTIGYSFPTNDYGAVNINDSEYWQPQAAVDMYNGSARVVSGYSQAAVGSSVCKSGRTTGWTCGTIQAYNQTVNYGNGDIVYGLVQHSACVEQGDSGGSNITGNLAQGITSGAQLYQSGSNLVCGSKGGQPTVSYYQPVGEALSANGLTLLTQ